MSLSAPELGTGEAFEIPPMRDAVSSTELLHERALARLYQEAHEEESVVSLRRRYSQDRKSVERRASLKERILERRHSAKEGDTIEYQRNLILEERASEPPSIRISFSEEDKQTEDETKVEPEKTVLTENNVISHRAENREKRKHEALIQKKEPRLNSVEREQLEFAMVRDKLREKNKENTLPPRPPTLQQQSSASSQMSSFEDETVEEEEEEDGYLDFDEDLEEEEFEQDEDDTMLNDSKYRPRSLMSQIPPPIPRHASPRRDIERPAPFAEEETYHPRSMIPTRSFVQKLEITLPATVEITDENEVEQKLTNHQQTEVIPEVNNIEQEPKVTEIEPKTNDTATEPISKIPVSKKPKKKSQILKKIEKLSLKKEKKPSAITTLIIDSTTPVASVVLPKPILKKKELGKKKNKDDDSAEEKQSKIPKAVKEDVMFEVNGDDNEESHLRKKKQVRIAEPGAVDEKTGVDPKLSPASARRARRLKLKQLSLEEDERANKVLIYHYSDIVKEYGGAKKPAPKMYLNYEELKAHADPDEEKNVQIPEVVEVKEQETAEVVGEEEPTEADETGTVELNEEGSLLDISEYDMEQAGVEVEGTVDVEQIAVVEETVEVKEPSPVRSGSQSPTNSASPDTVGFLVDYATDMALFVVACWLYLFKDERYAIPVLCLMVYRQINEAVTTRYRNVKEAILNKVPERFRKKSVVDVVEMEDEK
jgi:hypothetical protein